MAILEETNIRIKHDGTLDFVGFDADGQTLKVGFCRDGYAGPRWYFNLDEKEHGVELTCADETGLRFSGRSQGLTFSLAYEMTGNRLAVIASITNTSGKVFRPEKCGLKIGIDTYMDIYPNWNDKYFPTLLRCEKTHFWGYLMSPLGKILTVCSPDAIASWSLDYNYVYDNGARYGGHRIHTFNLEMLNAGPLPQRHPDELGQLAPGQKKQWTVFIAPSESLDEVTVKVADLCQAPLVTLEKYTLASGESCAISVQGKGLIGLQIQTPSGQTETIQKINQTGLYSYLPNDGYGVYTAVAENQQGKITEAKFYVRRNWSWYLKKARQAAIDIPQKASTHLESWYGMFSHFLANKHFPDATMEKQAEETFSRILPLMYDMTDPQPHIIPFRICNTACMIGLLTDAYEATGKISYLELAAKLADWLVGCQAKTGEYLGGWSFEECSMHYTSVIYVAKSMMELLVVEKRLGSTDPLWQERYEKHYASVKAAADELERNRDNIATEGQMTFEDGMISCTASQLGLFALLQEDASERQKYAHAASQMLEKHACLEQNLIPDCRMHGATLRFWEAQYDVLMPTNMLNSPHGWTSWKTYATWYLYQLTGREDLLRLTMDTLGTCMQTIDIDSGKLRWAFICDPQVKTEAWSPDPNSKRRASFKKRVIGEQYVEMISGWWRAPKDRPVGAYLTARVPTRDGMLESDNQGGCCDNDVHEHFKCLEEVALTSAYIIERQDGTIGSWNCSVQQQGGELIVTPNEDIVSSVHINLKNSHLVTVYFAGQSKQTQQPAGLNWIRKKDC